MDDVIRACLETQRELDDETGPIFLSKADAKSAFRILPLHSSSWLWLIMCAEHPMTGTKFYFMDKCLPFGASISCALFQRFSNALCYVIHFRTNSPPKRIMNYLDDFLFMAITLLKCNMLMQKFLDMCEEFGVPIAHEKLEWSCTRLIFLGILLDGIHMVLCIPEDKRIKAINLLKTMVVKSKATVKELQTQCEYLNFLTKAIYPGRAFTRHMYSKYSHIVKFNPWNQLGWEDANNFNSINKQNFKLKQYHHVRLDSEFKADCAI